MEDIEKEIFNCIKARYPLIYIISPEERRLERILSDISSRLKKNLFVWTSTKGFIDVKTDSPRGNTQDPLLALDFIHTCKQEGVIFILKDYHVYLEQHQIIRKLRDTINFIISTLNSLILISPILRLPPEIEKETTVIDYPLPTYQEIERLIDGIIKNARDQGAVVSLTSGEKEQIIKAVQGLTEMEIENVLYKGVVRDGRLDASDISLILREKEQVVKKSGIMEFFPAKENFEEVGGVDILKRWLDRMKRSFEEKAKERGLEAPKGCLLIGVPGCGKSYTAKAASNFWQYPLLRLDIGRIFGALVGQSEENMRKAIKTAESIAPCILWVDEIEKGLSGTQSALDSGVSSRVFGTFITWLQEKNSQVFVIATANEIRQLPPELLRKGRFDEIFFVDLPNSKEREEIFSIHLKKRFLNPEGFSLKGFVEITEGFSGSEIEQVIISAIRESYYEGRETTTEDIVRNIKATIPLSAMMKERIDEMRGWAKNNARPASAPKEVVEVRPVNAYKRVLDLGD